jgi:hypothetical protein
MTVKRAWLAVLGVAMLGSQAGHLLAYEVRFGASATQMQSSGAHAYFPGVVRTSLGVIAALVLAGLFLVGLARILSGRSVRPDSTPNLLRLVAVLYTLQLAWFAAQEVGEALLAGMPVDSVAHLLLWGTLGQLPVAVIAAVSLRWLLARFESAVTGIRVALAALPKPLSPPIAIAVSVSVHDNPALTLRSAAGAALAKRGPPSSLLLISSN